MNCEDGLYTHYHNWKSWDSLFTYTKDQAGYFSVELAMLAIDGADVLEIGFGQGSCVAWMAERGARVSVTEINEKSCAEALARGFEVLPTDLQKAAGERQECFDTIIAFDVFEHLDLDTVARYLDACSTLLKPGGRILLRFPNAQSPFGLQPQAGDPTHRSHLSLSVLKLMILAYPLSVVRYAGSHLFLGRPMSAVWFKRTLRRGLQRIINGLLNFTYASGIPYEPVVVIVMEKSDPL